MTPRMWVKLVSVFLAVLMPAAMLNAAAPVAVMYASVATLVNGNGSPSSSAIFSGDRITTTENSAANLVLGGSSITMSPESSLVYEGASFELETGEANVATIRGVGAHAGAVTVTPAALVNTRYRVARINHIVFVTATTGALQVADNGQQILLAEGKTMSFQDDQQSRDQNNKKNKGAGALPHNRRRLRKRSGAGQSLHELEGEGRNPELHLILGFRYWRAIRVYQQDSHSVHSKS